MSQFLTGRALTGKNKTQVEPEDGQVAQVVERSPEKAGVGGSTPSLATMFSVTYPCESSLLWLQLAPIDAPKRSNYRH